MIFCKKLGEAEVFSKANQYRLSFVFAIDICNREFEYFQYERGSFDEGNWDEGPDRPWIELVLSNNQTKKKATYTVFFFGYAKAKT